jgi:hypothetical protein
VGGKSGEEEEEEEEEEEAMQAGRRHTYDDIRRLRGPRATPSGAERQLEDEKG